MDSKNRQQHGPSPSGKVVATTLLHLLLVAGAQEANASQGNHLLISEVGYDTITESSPNSAEFVEILNPTHENIHLNQGAEPGVANGLGSYFITDEHDQYFEVVNGIVNPGITTSDAVFQFPLNTMIPAHSMVVVTADSDSFLNDYFGGSLAAFKNQPGNPQLFEAKQDGDDDGVPDMIVASTNSQFSLTNGGESMTLFYWDGQSDLVQDVDSVCWKDTDDLIDKDQDASGGIDGPDEDDIPSFYNEDLGTAVATLEAKGGTLSIQRRDKTEAAEGLSDGNGISSHDESSENAKESFYVDTMTPGTFALTSDGNLGDALSYLSPVAVSAADGSTGDELPADYGADGTLSELYLTTFDSDYDREVDHLYVALRGELFGADDGTTNASIILIDTDPAESNGYNRLNVSGDSLSDTTGSLDSRITQAGFVLSNTFGSVGFDAAVGLDSASSSDFDVKGWRSFGSADLPGTPADFAYIGSADALQFQGDISSDIYPGAPGTTISGDDGFEAILPLESLEGPEYIRFVAITTADSVGFPSPNTLPESASDSTDSPQIIEETLCMKVETGEIVQYYVDGDSDGYGDALSTYCGPADASEISLVGGDCDDERSETNPDATETCDEIDNDCDGLVDDDDENVSDQIIFYGDHDDDGYGDPADTVSACVQPTDYVSNDEDCDDDAAAIHPEATEICDDTDNDCDGFIDDDDDDITGQSTFYGDGDGDGFGLETDTTVACDLPSGYVENSSDCDDDDDAIHPEADEVCDTIDNDCDTLIDDEDDSVGDQSTWYADTDGDAHGDSSSSVAACFKPDDYVALSDDCDDNDGNNYPGNDEVCDGADNDCDGASDDNDPEGPIDPLAFYLDSDLDGFGDASQGVEQCIAPDGYISDDRDCDDSRDDIYPEAEELCDGADNDCNGVIPVDELSDSDEDGFVTCEDCDDLNPDSFPGATEICDGLDNDCDGELPTDELDVDEDTYLACEECDDGVAEINPAATEICDQIDNNCDGATDEGFDADEDGFYDPESCDYGDDCDDNRADIFPGATESCDEVDNDCDEIVDENRDTDGDGVSSCSDCDDNNNQTYPGADEICDGLDNDCDGEIPADEDDSDGDGFNECGLNGGSDCDDDNDGVYPGAAEICDGLDNDCNPESDELGDSDQDGVTICDGDCDDSNSAISPLHPEACDGFDTDCDEDTSELEDDDGDGYSACEGDCDDREETVYGSVDDNPAAEEICDGLDNDCNGEIPADEVDEDGDEYLACEECDDGDADLFPTDEAEVLCDDGIDNNCDGFTDLDDENCTPTPTVTPTPTEALTPTEGLTPTASGTPTAGTPTDGETTTPSETLTFTPTFSPTITVTEAPTDPPTAEPTDLPVTDTPDPATGTPEPTVTDSPTAGTPTPTFGDGGDGGCDCDSNPSQRPSQGAAALLLLGSIVALRRRRV